ncbi:AAA family ATPase [Colletotrichum camelliae]|nr:AAA family ATPase [Colletotrichum camelliae]
MGTSNPPGAVHNDDDLPEPTMIQTDLGKGNNASHSIPKLSDVALEGGNDAAFSGSGIAEELRALKAKIVELETLGRKESTNLTESQHSPKQTEELEQYQRMAKCLYSHRKEWEATLQEDDVHYTDLNVSELISDVKDQGRGWKYGPWYYEWPPYYGLNKYNRPNPFNRARQCPEGAQANIADDTMDEYDHAIDYSARRSRLRKTYEWEMDRLWLSEETEIRRRRALEEAEKQASKRRNAKGSPEDSAMDADMVFDDWGFAGDWFRSPQIEHRTNKTSKQAPSVSSQTQLPERIREHSNLVLRVLDKILKLDADKKMAESEKPMVFTRPFKALSYCQPGLDSWLLAMEQRARRQSTKLNEISEMPRTTDDQASQNLEVSATTDSGQLDQVGGLTTVEPATEKDVQSSVDSGSSERDSFPEHVSDIDKTANQADLEGLEDEEENETQSDMGDFEDVAKSPSSIEELSFFLRVTKTQILVRNEYLNGDKCQKVFFSDLWQLFRPGLEVIRSDGKQAYRVIHVTAAKHRTVSTFQKWSKAQDDEEKKPRPDFSITCIYLDFDGKKLGPVSRTFDLKPYEGEREITSFEVFPLRFYSERQGNFSAMEREEAPRLSDAAQLRENLIIRGRRFLDALATKHMFYGGSTLDTHEEVEGQVVVDFESAFNEETLATERPQIEALPSMNLGDYDDVDDCDATCCLGDRVMDDTFIDLRQAREYVNSLLPKTGAQDAPSVAVLPHTLSDEASFREIRKFIQEDELLILSFRVFGFILRNRKFAQLDMKFLSSMTSTKGTTTIGDSTLANVIENNAGKDKRTAFDRLVLEDGHKSMIESLISQHFRDKESKGGPHDQVDVVKGKGKGLILLLHGAPGVGKTSTAEGIAEMFGKPLFQITCGTTAKEVEETLESNFALANRWGCILLLDEADVFLAERTKEDFVRNGLVAVFLRVLEYYSGILFLTTNRVGDFDEAFTSRIHMSLYYPELSKEKTLRVFKINMDLIRERFALKGRQIIIEEMEIGAFATQHYINHPSARWNGRQIRNACQTALALAEYQAQGGRHDAIMKPDAVINLAVEHFETVRDAYLKFAEYMNKIYGTNAARKAKEGKLRAILVDENDNVVSDTRAGGRVDRKEAYRQSQSPFQMGGRHQHESPSNQHSQGYPQPSYQAQPTYQGPPQGYSHPQH